MTSHDPVFPQADGHVVEPGEDGQRLDKVLARLCPGLSLRGRRRLIQDGGVLVDGRPWQPGYKLALGQHIQLAATPSADDGLLAKVRVVAQTENYAALYKPAGLHSVALAGRASSNLEDLLPSLFPNRPNQSVRLVNRLDEPTSGLVLAAFGEGAAQAYQTAEEQGLITKTYLALVRGHLPDEHAITAALDVADRKRVWVLTQPDPNPLRHTLVHPLRHAPQADQTLVRAVIRKGARHQIRAHLASIGFPILGDELYGNVEEGGLYLHHARVEWPEFTAECVPEWRDASGGEVSVLDLPGAHSR